MLPKQAVEGGVTRHAGFDDGRFNLEQHFHRRMVRRRLLGRRGTPGHQAGRQGDPENSADHQVSAV
jgi:hypothetical protein